jgi:ABC-type Na+ efflux pump permease subunit
MGLITLFMTVPLMTMIFIVKDPHGSLAKVLSWVPFYTPFVMMNRAAAQPPWYEVVGTMLTLIAATALAIWAAVKIFHHGILRTGQPPRLLELLRLLRRLLLLRHPLGRRHVGLSRSGMLSESDLRGQSEFL